MARTFQAREQAELFMRLKAERGGDVRSWAEVSTVQQPLPEFVLAAKRPADRSAHAGPPAP